MDNCSEKKKKGFAAYHCFSGLLKLNQGYCQEPTFSRCLTLVCLLLHAGTHSAAGIHLREHEEPTAFAERNFLIFLWWWYFWVWLKKQIQNTKTWIFFFPFIPLTFPSCLLNNQYKEEKRRWKINKWKYLFNRRKRGCFCCCQTKQKCCIKKENLWKWLEILSDYFYQYFYHCHH